jgi:hypothetical protein
MFMSTRTLLLAAAALSSFLILHCPFTAQAATTIDAANHFAYGANLGWVDWRGDTQNGAVIGEYVCSGYIYSANVGWINLGNGSPTNGIYYRNLSPNDFGVNQDGLGNLRGYAWSANIGWLAFESTGAPRVDTATGKMSGYAWSANCGWISFSNAVAYVQTDSIRQGARAPNGLPIAWLLTWFGTTNVDANADADGDGMSNWQEYLAGTNPTDSNDVLRITYLARDKASSNMTLQWTSKPTRFYTIQSSSALAGASSWLDLASFGLGANSATFNTGTTNTTSFYRIRVYRPLGP